jgi:hypothetical protein
VVDLALAGTSVLLAATSDHVVHPAATALYYGFLVAAYMLIGLYWYVRRPGSAFGPLLVVFGAVAWVVSWQSAERALAFDLGVLAEGAAFFVKRPRLGGPRHRRREPSLRAATPRGAVFRTLRRVASRARATRCEDKLVHEWTVSDSAENRP